MTNHSPNSPTATESDNVHQGLTSFDAKPSRVPEIETMQKDLLTSPVSQLPALCPDSVVTATAYPITTHVVQVTSELIPAPAYALHAEPRRRSTNWMPVIASAALALTASYFWFRPMSNAVSTSVAAENHVQLVRATKAPLDSCLIEQGTLEACAQVAVSCPITSCPVSIASMLPYGTRVKAGDVVAKLDLTALHTIVADQQSKIFAARLKLTEAQEALDALKVKNEAELSTAELNLEFAQVDLTRYQNEEKQVELNDRRGQIAMAERDLKEAEEKLNYYRTFHKRGFISSEQLKAKEAELDRSRFSLAQSQSRLKIFERYMVPRQERTLIVKVEELKRDLSKLKKTHAAALVKAQADITTCKTALTAEETKLQGLQQELVCAEVKAPADGILAAPLAEAQKSRPTTGATLQPKQMIFIMPKMEELNIRIRLAEADMRKLRMQQAARINIECDGGMTCTGTLEKIEFQAESSWAKNETQPRDFVGHIKLQSQEPLDWTMLGSKARVEFTLDHIPDALQVPASAITEKDGKSFVMVMTGEGPAPRELRTGSTNGKNVEVRQGLEPGEKVLVTTKLKQEYVAMP